MMRTLFLLAVGAAAMLQPFSAGDVSNIPAKPRSLPVALNRFQSPPRHIHHAAIRDLNRDDIGTVQRVDVDGTGRPSDLVIQLSPSQRLISVPAYRVNYDAQHNIATVGISRAQIE
jgi:hypothetical protein